MSSYKRKNVWIEVDDNEREEIFLFAEKYKNF